MEVLNGSTSASFSAVDIDSRETQNNDVKDEKAIVDSAKDSVDQKTEKSDSSETLDQESSESKDPEKE